LLPQVDYLCQSCGLTHLRHVRERKNRERNGVVLGRHAVCHAVRFHQSAKYGNKDVIPAIEPLLTNSRSDIREEAYKAITKLSPGGHAKKGW
jgi:hypothetical protein